MEEFVMRHFVNDGKRKMLHFTPQQKELIFKEISYRVRENLNTIASIFGLQLLQAQAENDLPKIKAMQNNKLRINTFSVLQELYYPEISQEKLFEEYVYDILDMVENATGMRAKAEVHIDAGSLTQRQKILIGSIVTELYANTLEHVCRDSTKKESCQIKISLSQCEGKHHFLYQELTASEESIEKFKSENTIGLKLVNLHVREMHGEMRISGKEGVLFTIVF